MNIEEYRLYCLSKKGVMESFPFPKLTSVLVFKVFNKMFTATDINSFKSISVKTNSETIEELRSQYSCLDIQPYMDKKHWNKVNLDDSIPDSLLIEWIDLSYKLVVKNLNMKQQKELKAL